MRVAMTGATGFIGRAVAARLQRDRHRIVALVRSEGRARARLGADVETVSLDTDPTLTAALEGCDAIVNLAGESIAGGRWTSSRRRVLRDSRVGVTARLVQALAAAPTRPRVLISASAVGYYGNRGAEIVNERSAAGTGFLAQLCQEWEAAAIEAERLGVRVVVLRTGVVLGRDGGALATMGPIFRLGLGGAVGPGTQYMPWIHLHDLADLVARALDDESIRGPANGVAPDAVTNRAFAAALARALHRPAMLPVPAFALKLAAGEAASMLLGSQRVDPAVPRERGFEFTFPTLAAALADVIDGVPVETGPLREPVDAAGSEIGARYLAARRPRYELRMTTRVAAPVMETFSFFSKAENLGMLTPSAMGFSIAGPPPAIGEDAAIDYRLRVGLIPIRWRSRIVTWRPGVRFVDLQERGPYHAWWHEHAFRDEGSTTVMEDRVCYAPPLGALGRLVNRWFVEPTLRRVFRYRADVIRLRFGVAPPPRQSVDRP